MKYSKGQKLAYDSSTSNKSEEIIIVLTKDEIQKGKMNTGGNPDYLVESVQDNNQYFCLEKELKKLPLFFN